MLILQLSNYFDLNLFVQKLLKTSCYSVFTECSPAKYTYLNAGLKGEDENIIIILFKNITHNAAIFPFGH